MRQCERRQCCMMCNMVKSARDYTLFVLLFREFLHEHGAEYRAADPDDFRTIGKMNKRFDAWLRAQQEVPPGAEASGA
jgi:hypothetical protein